MRHARKIVAAGCWLVFAMTVGPAALDVLQAGLDADDAGIFADTAWRFSVFFAILIAMAQGHWKWTQAQRLPMVLVIVLGLVGVASVLSVVLRSHDIAILVSMLPIFPLSLFIAIDQVFDRKKQNPLP